jgi:hypothetical protein
MSDIDRLLERQRWRDAIEACTMKGVTELPPVAGMSYAAFAVHPPHRGNLLALAIGHRDGEKIVVDLIREDLGVAAAACELKRYGISNVAGAVGDEADALAHATAGVIHLLQEVGH